MGVKRAQNRKNDCWEMAKTWIQLTSKQAYLFPIHLNKIWGFGVLGFWGFGVMRKGGWDVK